MYTNGCASLVMLDTEILASIILHALIFSPWLICGVKPSRCCEHIPRSSRYSDCRDACEKLWLSSGPLQQVESFSFVYRYCPVPHLTPFWTCLGIDYPILSDIEIWEGRACCELAASTECLLACQQGKSLDDFEANCQQLGETKLSACLIKQADSAACCHNTNTEMCKAACRSLFVTNAPTDSELQENVRTLCVPPDNLVSQCIANRTTAHPPAHYTGSLDCCQRATTSKCRATCMNSLLDLTDNQQIMQALIADCDEPPSVGAMWQCFLLSGASPVVETRPAVLDIMAINGAAMQCCAKAATLNCQTLCLHFYEQQKTSSRQEFHQLCELNDAERQLHSCIQDVEEPCKPGCERLEFCSNFNRRPTKMFRKCDREADKAARLEYSVWLTNREIRLPSISIPIQDITDCYPEMWKAVSCALHVKPCQQSTHSNFICKSDCLNMLNRCIDRSQTSYDISAVCDLLPVSDDLANCISLEQFTRSAPDTKLTTPCLPNPCNTSHVCEVNRDECVKNDQCKPYICHKACPIGETSSLLIPVQHYAALPDISTQHPLDCFRICKCGQLGQLSQCSKETQCVRRDSCVLDSSSILEHGAKYNIECNQCVCHSAKNICSAKSCRSANDKFTGLPCGCLSHYQPVCTRNGRVFPNACLAKCVGFNEEDYEFGNCASKNACGNNPCEAGYKCLSRRQTCLSSNMPCPQFECSPSSCSESQHGPVCDTSGEQHPNVCSLLARRRQLSYKGACLSNCDYGRTVCGVDGETYMSECSALAAGVLVDYHSQCRDVPHLVGGSLVCKHTICSRYVPEWCEMLIPPGACCPICGAVIRTLFSAPLALSLFEKANVTSVSLGMIRGHLRGFISTAQCDVYTYISLEEELIIVVTPSQQPITKTQVQSCELDAERITTLIETRSPLIYTNAALGFLLRATLTSSTLIETDMNQSGPASCQMYLAHYALIIIMYFVSRYQL